MEIVLHTNTEEETKEIAYLLGKIVQPNDVILLEGDLGAGKTTFTKGFAKGLEVKRNVNSPTFNIIKEYKGRIPLYHMDVYRLEGSNEDLGFEEYFMGEGVCVVEWAHLISDYLPNEFLKIIITHKEDGRVITFIPKGNRYELVCEELIKDDRFSN
ncbi:tRNA (adenosine(37)-N6)-threonylcarbamoyltransferase complex ATPase subunit type 1 TsaE [Bacillus sp. EAC]|uniref:tRNA (adenosine(37)-N6)-threonylcarbamoyltransferase complex ATPase subunit type 1 TsaE n=1 Tax=Bacillus sp. EAC TaxID=1978338 RepID=UPI000B454F36|nr:tRNA (adenosine(37)-N6)-threonylcarbamoyltransferase complex ATPase subunit type 1 TsaE [Bacillus sp. EAC]